MPCGLSRYLPLFAVPVPLAIAAALAADATVRFQPLDHVHLDSYDYNPAIVWDDEESRWVMFHCGYYAATRSDAIYRSVSVDGLHWTIDPPISATPTAGHNPVLTAGPAAWDAGHVCDPIVLASTSSPLPYGVTWAMWYGGVDRALAHGAKVGVATSGDGVVWTKRGVAVDCGRVPTYGCGQPSVTKVGRTFFMSHTEILPGSDPRLRVRTSTDGVSWSAGSTFRMPDGAVDVPFMYADGIWYSGAISGWFEQVRIFASRSIEGAKTEVGSLHEAETQTELPTGRRFVGSPRFYRTGLGHLPTSLPSPGSASPGLWFAFSVAPEYAVPDRPWMEHQEIEAAVLWSPDLRAVTSSSQ